MNAALDALATALVTGPVRERYDEILSDEALEFLRQLHRCF